MRFCPKGPSYHLLVEQEHWIHQTNLSRKWRSSPLWLRRSIVTVVSMALIALLIYNLVTSSLWLNQMSPRVRKHTSERLKCCLTGDDNSVDLCGRSDCLWPCPYPPAEDYVHLSTQEDKIFFHETSGSPSLNIRQACVVESMAYRNPNMTVNLLMTGQHIETNSITMWTLQNHYPNLQVTLINLVDYLTDTPLAHWYSCTEWNRGWFAVSHLSDALRFLSLAKYGGYYFDLDIIQLKSVSPYRNFIVPEDMGKLGSSVIHVDLPHPIVQMAVEEFAADYRWFIWAHNGPELITRVLQRWCNVYYISWMTPERCAGFRVVPPKTFYPFHYTQWKSYFLLPPEEKMVEEMRNWDDSVRGAHIWNSLSAGWTVKKNSDQIYVQIARESCPRIFEVAPDEF